MTATLDKSAAARVLRPHAPAMRAELVARARSRLSTFSRLAWRVLEPTTPLEWNWHLDAICDHVQAVLDGWMAVQRARAAGLPDPPQAIQNLVMNVPPGTGKSRFVSVFAPAWMWLHWPTWRSMFICGNPRVALRDADYCRMLLESDWYRTTFAPEWQLARDQNAKSYYRNTAGGALFKAEWFEFVDPDKLPPMVRRARGWDLAATDPNGTNDPDWTAGVLLGTDAAGAYYVLNVRRTRVGPLGTEQFVGQTAAADGKAVAIRLPEDPGASGKSVAFHYLNKVLRGYAARAERVTGDKATRAAPFSAACERRAVKIVRGDWNVDYLDELTAFPRGGHDDQVDATSDAFDALSTAATVAPMSASYARQ